MRPGACRPAARPLRQVAAAVAIAVAALSSQAATPVVPNAPADEPTQLWRVERGDTLIGLSNQRLEQPALWREIAKLNRLRQPNRLQPDQVLRVPVRLLKSAPEPATVLNVTGPAQAGAGALQPGQRVDEGSTLATGDDGHVTLQLADGTVLRLRPSSRLQLERSRRVPGSAPGEASEAGVQLQRGRVEVEAAKASAGRPGFRVRTPQGVLGVRGTEFRVASDETTRGEVLGGRVSLGAAESGAARPGELGAGQGSVVDAAGRVAPPVPLLAAPDLGTWPALQEVPVVQFPLPALGGAQAWHAQVARDARFDQVQVELQQPSGPVLRIAGLPDGDWHLRLRAVDARGLEGRDADHRFMLKARPEPPLPSAPPPRAVLFGGSVDLAWASNDEAASYRLQVARDPAFTDLVRDESALTGSTLTVDGLAPGTYHWRLGSTRADGDRGPWGAARSFELRPIPPGPKPPAIGDHALSFSWDGQPGQQWDFELSRGADFRAPLVQRRLDTPSLELPRPGAGRYHLRLRTIEADGFVGPWTRPQTIDLPNCLRDGAGNCVRAGGTTLNLQPER